MPPAATATPTSTKLEPAPHTGRPTPPGPPGPEQFHGFTMLWAEQRQLAYCHKRYGDVFTLNIPYPFERLVVIADPAEVKRLFGAAPELAHAGRANRVLEPLVGLNSVLELDEGRHMQQRKLMLPAFHGERMRVYGDMMREVTEAEIERWPLGRPFAVHHSTQAITLRVICRAVFGIEDEAKLREMETALIEMTHTGQRVIMVKGWQRDLGKWSPGGQFVRARERADELLFAEIRARREAPDLEERADVLSLLLQARDEDGNGMTDVELRDELVTLLVAGHETTASQLAWTLERLLRTPAALERLAARAARGRRLPRLRDQGVPARAAGAHLLGAAHGDRAGRGRAVQRAGGLDDRRLGLADPAPPGPLPGPAGVPSRALRGGRPGAAFLGALRRRRAPLPRRRLRRLRDEGRAAHDPRALRARGARPEAGAHASARDHLRAQQGRPGAAALPPLIRTFRVRDAGDTLMPAAAGAGTVAACTHTRRSSP